MTNIMFNGKPKRWVNQTIVQLLQSHNISLKAVAVAINGEVLPKNTWHKVAVSPNDAIEVVRAVPGG